MKKETNARAAFTARKVTSLLVALLFVFLAALPAGAVETTMLIPGGICFGAKLSGPGLTVTALAEGGAASAAGIRRGDILTAIDGTSIASPTDLSERIAASGGKTVTVTVMRNRETKEIRVTPLLSDGSYRIGVSVRDGAAGVGTVTFFTPSGGFGGLGHGIFSKETGELVSFTSGSVYGVRIEGVRKGLSGNPGEILGVLEMPRLGSLAENTRVGVFGLYAKLPTDLLYGLTEVATPEELTRGAATVLTTLGEDGIGEYSIEILSIAESRKGEKAFTVKVTDPRLLARTGGIVQGMSGSPILQNGKLVGAVTHVTVGDPTEGYGIFIDTMLDAMPEILR